jgi:16S rRNA (guanine527-N7)-methyltransferase
LPGLPLAIARADLSVTLVEPLERRVRFLLETVDALQLTNCRVIRGRAEEVIAEAGRADVVTSRAVAPLHRLVGWSAPLIRDGGLLLAMKGSSARDELERDRAAVTAAGLTDAEVVELDDGSGEATYVVRAKRTASRQQAGRRSKRSGR